MPDGSGLRGAPTRRLTGMAARPTCGKGRSAVRRRHRRPAVVSSLARARGEPSVGAAPGFVFGTLGRSV